MERLTIQEVAGDCDIAFFAVAVVGRREAPFDNDGAGPHEVLIAEDRRRILQR